MEFSANQGEFQQFLLQKFCPSEDDKSKLLFEASGAGNFEAVKALLRMPGVDMNWARSSDGSNGVEPRRCGATPLFESCRNGHARVVKLLLGAGADKDKAKSNGTTPLYVAAQKNHVGVMKELLKAGADRNKAMESGGTPLCVAAQKGHDKCVELLLEHGANKDAATGTGATPLYKAAQQGHVGIVKALLQKGYYGKNYSSLTIALGLGKASENRQAGGEEVTDPKQAMTRRERSSSGVFSLSKSTVLRILGFLSLSGKGADAEKADADLGCTPLIIASIKDHADIVSLLLEAGADADMKKNDGATALICAAGKGHLGSVRLLINAGADRKIQDSRGKTALARAQHEGHSQIVSFLK